MDAIRKLRDFWECDGPRHTLGYVGQNVLARGGYRLSQTIILECLAPILSETARDDLSFRMYDDPSALKALDYPRLRHVPIERWMAAGSLCCVGFVAGSVASYCWIHVGEYDLGHSGRFILRDGEGWVGPVFVDRRFRRRGINSAQLEHAMRDARERGMTRFYTATNMGNFASLKSFVKRGFRAIALVEERTLMGRVIACATLDIHPASLTRQRFR